MAPLIPPPPPPRSSNDLETRIDVTSLTGSPWLPIESGPPLSLHLCSKFVAYRGKIFASGSSKTMGKQKSAFENLDLGKTVVGLAFPAAIGLVDRLSQATTNHQELLLQLLTTGFANSFGASFMAVLLRQSYPRTANAGEMLGAVSAVITFFTLVSCYMPTSLMRVLVICCILCLCPFILLFFKSSDECEQLLTAASLDHAQWVPGPRRSSYRLP